MPQQTSPAATPALGFAAALRSSGLSAGDLDDVLPLPEGTTTLDILAGTYAPGMDVLVAAAAFTGTSVEVLSGWLAPQAPLTLSLRSDRGQESFELDAALADVERAMAAQDVVAAWSPGAADTSPLVGFAPSPAWYGPEAGRESAERVRDVLGIGNEPLGDLIGLVEAQGHPVLHRALPDGTHGLTVREERLDGPVWAVVVAIGVPWTRQRYTLAHEFCHVLHADPGRVMVELASPGLDVQEVRAEAFARHLLLPQVGLRDEVGRVTAATDWDSTVVHLMLTFGVSRTVVVKALIADGIAPAERLQGVLDAHVGDMVRRADRAGEWAVYARHEHKPQGSPALAAAAAELYAQGKVGVKVVAGLLGLPAEETVVELLRKGYAPATA